jgi:hypothetical protein
MIVKLIMVRIHLFPHHHLVVGRLARGIKYESSLDSNLFIGIYLTSAHTQKPTVDNQDSRDQKGDEVEKKRATA